MIGEKTLAQKAGTLQYDSRAPKGWKTVGMGGYRKAFLAPDGMVYKVMHGRYDDENVNQMEYHRASRLRRKAKYLARFDIAIPPVSAYKVKDWAGHSTTVNVMPYLPSQKTCDCSSYGWNWEESDLLHDPAKCDCRKWGERRTCFGLVYKVLEDLGLEDMCAPNVSYYEGKIYPIDLGE